MRKLDWIFVWESSRNVPWDNASQNLNMVVDFEHFLDQINQKDEIGGILRNLLPADHLNINIPANVKHVPKVFQNIPSSHKLDGQILDQFENESFKYVLQKHQESRYNKNHELVIKEHLYPNIALDETNCKTLDLDHINKLLDKNEWVGLGTFFEKPQNEFDKLNAIASSVYFTRDKDTLKIKNLSRVKQFNPRADYLSCITYVIFKKLKDKNIIVGMLNPNLISLTHFINVTSENHLVSSVSSFDDLGDYFLRPKIISGIEIGDKTIFSENGIVEIEMCGMCPYKYMHGRKPKFDFNIKTNLKYEIDGDFIKVDVKKHGYLVIEYDVGNMFDYNFDKRKIERERVEFTLFKE